MIKKNNNNTTTEYDYIFDIESAKMLIGLLTKNTDLLASYRLTETDFVKYTVYMKNEDGTLYRNPETNQLEVDEDLSINFTKIFEAIYNAYVSGKPVMYQSDFNGLKYNGKPISREIKRWSENAKVEDLDFFYTSIRKSTLLREAAKAGNELHEYIWHKDGCPEKRARFNKATMEELSDAILEPTGKVVLEQGFGKTVNS